MNAARLDSLSRWGVSFDFETHWIQPGLAAPPPVCASVAVYRPDDPAATSDGMVGRIMTAEEGCDLLDQLLADDRIVIVGQNIAFDLLVYAVHRARQGRDVMPAIFAAYLAGRIYECQVAEMLHAIAEGHLLKDPRTGQNLVDPDPEVDDKRVGYRLSVLVDLVLGRADAKVNDEFRERYHELAGIALAEWPWSARQYPVDDACNTLATALAQVGAIPNVGIHKWHGESCRHCGLTMEQARAAMKDSDGADAQDWRRCTARWRRRNAHQVAFQTYSAWCLHLGAAWGFRTDPVALDILEGCVLREREAGAPRFLEAGLLRMKTEKGVTRPAKHMSSIRRAVALAYGCTGDCATCRGERRLWDREKDRSKRDPEKRVGQGRACPDCGETGVDLKSAVVPMSDPSDTKPDGQVGTGRDVLFESGDDLLADFAEYQLNDKIVATYIPALRAGVDRPWTLRANVLLDTGRVSYSGAAQTLPRNTPAGLTEALRKEASRLAAEGRTDVYVPRGVRDCIVARPGAGFFSVDFRGGELVTFAVSAKRRVGFSRLGEALNKGLDAHAALAAQMLGWSYEKMAAVLKDESHPEHKLGKAIRQCAKWGNFGFLGGMKPVKFVLTQRRQGDDTPHPAGPSRVWNGSEFVAGYKGFRLCIPVLGTKSCGAVKVTSWNERPCTPTCRDCIVAAEKIYDAFMATWPEASPYLKWHQRNADQVGEVVQHGSKRIRGGVDYNSEANGDFQGLLADIAKASLQRVAYLQYVDKSSVLYGSRTQAFLHDELLGEAALDVLPEVAVAVKHEMRAEFRAWCPEFPDACDAEEAISERWSKGMSPKFDANGRLLLWTPKPWKLDVA